jgi:hypothetical protein
MADGIYHDFHIPLSTLRRWWKRAVEAQANGTIDASPAIQVRLEIMAARVVYLEQKLMGQTTNG